MEHNFAAYQSGSFAIDITNLSLNETFFDESDLPAFFHEYCHYIQDISQISSIFGFSLWMRDVVAMTQIFSKGEGREYSIPLDRDKFDEPINKYRKFYMLYCGDVQTRDFEYSNFNKVSRQIQLNDIALDGNIRKLAVNYLTLEGQIDTKVHFGLIALQEIHAFYAQSLLEQNLTKSTFNIPTEKMKSFPYKFGDFLFSKYEIEIDVKSRFILIDLCLDSIQAPSIFLDVLEALKGKHVSYFNSSRQLILEAVSIAQNKCSFSTDLALKNILPDLTMWANDPTRKYLSQALDWYNKQIQLVYNLKKITHDHDGKEVNFRTFFSMAFCMPIEHGLKYLFNSFPPPAYIKNGAFYRNYSEIQDQNSEFEKNYEAANTIWSHRVVWDLLSSSTTSEINSKCKCPLYESCTIRTEEDSYTCMTAPWEIIRGKQTANCSYGMAAHSFGLWQNVLNIKP